MKKIFLVLSVVLTAGIIIISCSKKDDAVISDNSTGNYTEKAMNIWFALKSFKNKVNSETKTGTFITQDSAMFYLEGLFNVTHAQPGNSYHDLVGDSTWYNIEVNEQGLVSMDDVIATYNQMEADLNNQLANIDDDVKFLIAGDLQSIETSRSGDMELMLDNSLGRGQSELPYMFEEIDDWYYGNMLGRSDGAYLWESDAGEELEWRFNYIQNPQQLYFVATVDNWYSDYPTNSNPYGDYRIWMRIDTFLQGYDEDPIIHDDTLNYYYPEGVIITHKTVSQGGGVPDTLGFISVDVKSSHEIIDTITIGVNTYEVHKYEHYYPTKVGSTTEIPDL